MHHTLRVSIKPTKEGSDPQQGFNVCLSEITSKMAINFMHS